MSTTRYSTASGDDAAAALTPDQVRALRDLHAQGLTEADIARKLGISQRAVSEFLRKERRDALGKMMHRKKI